MQGFLQQNNSLIWTLNHETVRIEPWGRDSLRVRATVSAGIRDDLLSVLLSPAETDTKITIGKEGAAVSNWATTGHAGWPKQRRNSITGSLLVLPPPGLWNITPMRPAILLNFLNGQLASGNVNSVIGPKMNSCRSHANTNGEVCRFR